MWTPFGQTEEKIRITKASLLEYGKSQKTFRKEEFINDLCYIYKVEGSANESKKHTISEQVELKLKYLIEKGFLIKDGDFITIKKESKNPSRLKG